MKIKDTTGWETGLANNRDPYGAAAYRYAETWANLMEEKIENGEKLSDIAESTSHEADVEGITGFMYGCAVSVLSNAWEYGDELRKWHNKEYDYEGDGVVNPAILTVSAR